MLAARYPTSGPDSGTIRLETVPRPEPGVGEVLVAVVVSGVNPTDWKSRSGGAIAGGADIPWVIPNQDGAGVIVAVGDGVPAERVGERVWMWEAQWQRASGTAAEYIALPSTQAVPLPDKAGFDLGAGLGIPAMTAYHCLFADGPLGPGDQVLVQGGAGAVGHAAIELAVHAGAKVAATVSGPEKGTLAKAAGAELVVDYRTADVAAAVRAWAPDGVARIIEVNLARNLEDDAKVIAEGGVIVVYARTFDAVTPPPALMASNASIAFMLIYKIPQTAKLAALEGVAAALAEGALTELPSTRFTLADAAAAHDAVAGSVVGKVLIDVATPTGVPDSRD